MYNVIKRLLPSLSSRIISSYPGKIGGMYCSMRDFAIMLSSDINLHGILQGNNAFVL